MTESVETIDEIEGIFGPIAYYKAGSVLRMFENVVTPLVFQEALRNYLKTNYRQVVTPKEFYQSVEEILARQNFRDFNFTDAFRTWELQKGYPVVHVSFNRTRSQFDVTQKRFFIDPNLRDDADSSWTIPINFATSLDRNFDNTSISFYFEAGNNETVFAIDSRLDPEWFVFNKQQLGYYRVNYDLENWNKLQVVLNSDNFTHIHVLNRAQLVDDALSFAKAGLIDENLASGILAYLRLETDYIPWAAAAPHLTELYELFGGRNQEFNVRSFPKLSELDFKIELSRDS